MTRTLKVSDYVAEFLHAQGVRCVFELVGGMITHLIDSIGRNGQIRLVSVHHEQAASFAADAVGRVAGVPGVAMATSGPGATNLITGIGSCYFDSSPAVFITGQVNRHEQKGNRAVRQLGFQETDIVAVVEPLTKASWRVRSPTEVPSVLADAFRTAISGRRGPVLLDIPMDVQRAQISAESPERILPQPVMEVVPSDVVRLFDEMRRAKRPLILAGGGIRSAEAQGLFRDFVAQTGIPVVHSLLAADVLPSEHPLRVGMIGTYGNRWANLVLGQSDLLLVLGSRLDVRQTGSNVEAFAAGRTVFHVDCELEEINNRVKGCFAIPADLRSFLTEAKRHAKGGMPERKDWLSHISQLRLAWPDTAEQRGATGINPNQFMHQLSAVSQPATAYVVDVGQHQMWAAQSLEIGENQHFLTSGGMGAMGFALPAAIGVATAFPNQPVVAISGDGGFQLNLQELQTVVRGKLPLKIVVVDNKCHGMVRQFQQSYFGERYQSTLWGYSSPDFRRIAEAYGIPAMSVTDARDVERSVNWLWQNPTLPALLQVHIDSLVNAYPKVAFGRPIMEMEPLRESNENWPTD